MDWTIDRLQELRAEYASGESQLTEIERHRDHVRDQLLRIEGAIRVLEEQLASGAGAGVGTGSDGSAGNQRSDAEPGTRPR